MVAFASSFDTFDRFDFFDLDISSSGVRLLKIQLLTALQVWCAPCLIASGRSDVEDLGSWVIVARKHIAPWAVELNVRATGKTELRGSTLLLATLISRRGRTTSGGEGAYGQPVVLLDKQWLEEVLMRRLQKVLAICLSWWMLCAPGAMYATPMQQSAGQVPSAPVEKQTPEELQQLVAPIALYPDALVSQILAGATYPTEIVQADRWVQEHSTLKGKDLANAVDQQSWDPSIKALTQFPSVLANMDKNLSWTSALGEAYVNQQEAVMDAVQVMRSRAKTAGNLESNKQVKVVTEGPTIVVEPADPEVVYVPAYDPWIVYGAPVVVWPGWYPYPGLYVAGPGVSFGVGFAVGLFAGFAWGSHGWGCDWGHRTVVFNHNTFISNSKTFYGGRGRGGFRDFGAARGYEGSHNSGAGRGYEGSHGPGTGRGDEGSRGGDVRGNGFHGGAAERGSSESHAEAGAHSGAFGGYDHGGTTRSYSDRGNSSLHGGGFHEGGSHAGRFGGRR